MVIAHREHFESVHVEEHGAFDRGEQVSGQIEIREVGHGLQRVRRDTLYLRSTIDLFKCNIETQR